MIAILAIITGTSDSKSNMVIEFVGNTNLQSDVQAVFRLRNDGNKAIQINAYCTLYWKNDLGMATNAFYKHSLGYAMINPTKSTLVDIPYPHEAKAWDMSLTYQVRPSSMQHLINEVRYILLPNTWVPDNSFIGRLSPTVTNSAPDIKITRHANQ